VFEYGANALPKSCRESRNDGSHDEDREVADDDTATTPCKARQQRSDVPLPARKIHDNAQNADDAVNAVVSAEYRRQTRTRAGKEKTPASRLLPEKRQDSNQHD
jgi:hypothetical protein